ncbi:MAG: hypothetical protein J6P32_01760 [Stomatobaculum sp.]|nr:hypothetical protein [Stomatobaculum sp.]
MIKAEKSPGTRAFFSENFCNHASRGAAVEKSSANEIFRQQKRPDDRAVQAVKKSPGFRTLSGNEKEPG